MIISITFEKYEKQYCQFKTFHKIKNYCDELSEKREDNFNLKLFRKFSSDKDTYYYQRILYKLIKIPYIGRIFRRMIEVNIKYYYDFMSTMVDVLSEIRFKKQHNLVFQSLKVKENYMRKIDKEIFNFKETIYNTLTDDQISIAQTRQVFYHLKCV